MLSRSFKALGPKVYYNRLYSKVAISKYDSQTINYKRMEERVNASRKRLGRPLTLTEKLIVGHQPLRATSTTTMTESEDNNSTLTSSLLVVPDRVACQDATAPMVLLQFMNTGLSQVALPTTVHCDRQVATQHYHPYKKPSPEHQKRRPLADLGRAHSLLDHQVDCFLAAACDTYNIGLWHPGSGILHHMLLEKYAYPGSLILGTDRRMAHVGGLASLGFAVGGAEALDAMVGLPWEMLPAGSGPRPPIVSVHLKGSLSGWTTPKDVLLKLSTILSNQRLEKNTIVEYTGPGLNTLSCTGMATICNMGADIGALSSLFPFTNKMDAYLRATSRHDIANLATQHAHLLQADEHATYDHRIELDLTTLEPHIYGPCTPDLATPLSKFKQQQQQQQQKTKPHIQVSHIGSSYQDLARSASLVQQALAKGLTFKTSVTVTPGSTQIRSTLDRDGATKTFKDAGGILLANACGPCISSWNQDLTQHAALEKVDDGSNNKKEEDDELEDTIGDDRQQQQQQHYMTRASHSILSSYNHSSSDQMDGKDHYIASPEIVTALAFANSLQFNPMTDSLIGKGGIPFKFKPPIDTSNDEGIPQNGFVNNDDPNGLHRLYQAPTTTTTTSSSSSTIHPDALISAQSTRIARLVPFTPPSISTFTNLPILFKVKGPCTTEHISMTVGHWVKYRAHLDNLSNNLLMGAINADNGKRNWIKNRWTGDYDGVAQTARHYKQRGIPWVLIAEDNYGAGSASEHGAMESRYLNGVAIIAKSFASSHEMNMKKQGILPLQFTNPSDYDKIDADASVSLDIQSLAPGKPLILQVSNPSKENMDVELTHSFTQDQIHWFKSGSALNYIVSRIQADDMERTVQEA